MTSTSFVLEAKDSSFSYLKNWEPIMEYRTKHISPNSEDYWGANFLKKHHVGNVSLTDHIRTALSAEHWVHEFALKYYNSYIECAFGRETWVCDEPELLEDAKVYYGKQAISKFAKKVSRKVYCDEGPCKQFRNYRQVNENLKRITSKLQKGLKSKKISEVINVTFDSYNDEIYMLFVLDNEGNLFGLLDEWEID